MKEFIRKLDPSWIRGLISVLLCLTVIFGFFVGLIPVEFIKDLTIMALSFYFGSKVPTYQEQKYMKESIKNP
jgi:uncharacterized membrane protein